MHADQGRGGLTRFLIQHHPSRAGLLERTEHLDPIVVTDEGEGFNPWRNYLACLRVGANLGSPFVILQDDTVPVPGFSEAAERAREKLPQALIAFCVQGMLHQNARSRFWRAIERGEQLVEITPHNWVPAMALGWTHELAQRALDWDAQQTRLGPKQTADDGRLYYFVRWAETPVWMTVPSLVDHADEEPSVDGGGKGMRRPSRSTLLLFEGDARDWALALP